MQNFTGHRHSITHKEFLKNLNICLKSLINYIQKENCATIPMIGILCKNCPKRGKKRMGGKML